MVTSQRQERQTEPTDGSVLDVVGGIRRHWVLIVAVVLCTTLAGVLLSALRSPGYTATASVVVGSPADAVGPTTINMATEKQIAASPAVAEGVVESLAMQTKPVDLLDGVSVDVPIDTNILRISYTAPAPRTAQRLANAFATSYLRFREQSAVNGVQEATRLIDDRINDLTRRLREVQARSATEPDEATRTALRAEGTSLITEISILEQRVATTTTTGIVPGRVIAPALTPRSSAGPRLLLNGLLGAFLGVLLAIGAVIVIETFDGRVRGRDDIVRAAGARILGDIEVPGSLLASTNGDGLLASSSGRASTAFRRLRTNVLVALDAARRPDEAGAASPFPAGGPRTVAIVSDRGELETSYVTANLAATLANAGRRVTVVSPSASSRLTAMLHARVPLDAVARAGRRSNAVAGTPSPDLSVTSAARVDADLVALDVDGAARILDNTMRIANLALVQAPPLNDGLDGGSLIAASDVALYVTWDDADHDDVARARTELEALGTPMLGIVVLHRTRAAADEPDRAGDGPDAGEEPGAGEEPARPQEKAARL